MSQKPISELRRRRCRHPLVALEPVAKHLKLPNGCDPLLVDVHYGTGSQIFTQGAEATLPNKQQQ